MKIVGTFAGIDYMSVIQGTPRFGLGLLTEKVVQHLIKCMDGHQLKTVIIQIDYTTSTLIGKLKSHKNDFCTLLFISFSPKVK